jgi:ketosteroid isomerase-like protein
MFNPLPNFAFEVRDVLVKGWPRDMTVATGFRFLATLRDERLYENVVVRMIEIRWERVTRGHTIEDSLSCSRILPILAAQGCTEVLASPIIDAAS